jgi:hypothetical protein
MALANLAESVFAGAGARGATISPTNEPLGGNSKAARPTAITATRATDARYRRADAQVPDQPGNGVAHRGRSTAP